MNYNNFTLTGNKVLQNKRWWYEVVCSCGAITHRRLDHLQSGRTKMCKKCSSKQTAKRHPPPDVTQSAGNLGRTYYNTIRYGAERRDLEFSVSQEYLWELFEQQHHECALSGVELTLSTKTKDTSPDWSAFNASLDRIDSSKGYTKGNVQWVHRDINRMKGDMDNKEFLNWCRIIGNYWYD